MAKWQKIDFGETRPYHIAFDDECYFARDYISKGGHDASEANQLISNLKKKVARRGFPDWKYKQQAIETFARELGSVLPQNAVVACIPSSKCKTDSEYDGRLPSVLQLLGRIRPDIAVVDLFSTKNTIVAAHEGGDRSPDALFRNLVWTDVALTADRIFLIDDVVTTGGHFKACQRLVMEKCPGVKVIGLFWGKTVWPKHEDPGQTKLF
jgi:hypothetical protein